MSSPICRWDAQLYDRRQWIVALLPRKNGVPHLADALSDLHPSTATFNLMRSLILKRVVVKVVEVVVLFVLFKGVFFESLIHALVLEDDTGKAIAWECSLYNPPELLEHRWR